MSTDISLVIEWILRHKVIIGWSGSISLIMFLGFLIAGPIIILALPDDYFITHTASKTVKDKNLPLRHLIYLIFKNMVGGVFILAGLIMLFLPGQGLITIILGLSLLNVPGKHSVTLKILHKNKVLRAMNRFRTKFDKAPFKIY